MPSIFTHWRVGGKFSNPRRRWTNLCTHCTATSFCSWGLLTTANHGVPLNITKFPLPNIHGSHYLDQWLSFTGTFRPTTICHHVRLTAAALRSSPHLQKSWQYIFIVGYYRFQKPSLKLKPTSVACTNVDTSVHVATENCFHAIVFRYMGRETKL